MPIPLICRCEALARQRYNTFGGLTVAPKDVSKASVRDLCLFIRSTGLLNLCWKQCLGLHNKPKGCGASEASADRPHSNQSINQYHGDTKLNENITQDLNHKLSWSLLIADALLHYIPIFPQVFDECRIYDTVNIWYCQYMVLSIRLNHQNKPEVPSGALADFLNFILNQNSNPF